jgi:hypothetical protein
LSSPIFKAKGDIALFTPVVDEVEGDYDDEWNDCVREERCKRILVSSLNSNMNNNRAISEAVEGDAHGFRLNFGNNPCNSINMLEHNQMILFK